MKVARFYSYGPPEVIKLEESPVPSPGPHEVLVRNCATAVTAADCRIRGANFPKGYALMARMFLGLTKPSKKVQILGAVFSGVVEAVGEKVTLFKKGDAIMGMKSPSNLGTYAEYLVVSENSAVAHKPSSVSHHSAAGVLFGGTTALYFLRDRAQVKKGDHVLVIGAAGAVGTNAVQLAKYYGATVTAVCSTKNISLLKKLGADNVIDYTKHDIQKAGQYDIVLNAASNLGVNQLATLVKPGGTLLVVHGDLWDLLQTLIPWLKNARARRVRTLGGVALERQADVEFLASLVAKGELQVVIDQTYPLSDIVAAHRHADTGHKVGNVIVSLD